ncbi:MAG: hypothetical protein AB7O57_04105 [Hyphomicrobiaceae bacterium]
METLKAIFLEATAWFKFFKGPEWFLPLVAAVLAAAYLGRKIKSMKMEMEADFIKLVGTFRSEISKLLVTAEESLKTSARQAGDALSKRAGEVATSVTQTKLDEKVKSADEAQLAAVKVSEAESVEESSNDSREAEINWAEISAGWAEVWEWIKELRIEAIQDEKGRAKGHLRELDLRSPRDVIIKLYNYGWFNDRASNLALEMAAIYMQHRGRARANLKAVKRFRKLFREWNSLD